MENTVFIERLKSSHQNALEDIDNAEFKVDLLALIHSSTKKGLLNPSNKSFSYSNPYLEKTVGKLNSLLPKGSDSFKLNIFESIIRNLKSGSLALNLPTTLVRLENCLKPYLIQTNPSGKVYFKESNDHEFFSIFNLKSSTEEALFCYKIPYKGFVSIYNKDETESAWKLSIEECDIMQEFIKCRTNQISITRVLWRLGQPTKYFTIIKRNKIKSRPRINPKINSANNKFHRKNTSSEYANFKYTDFLQKTSQSINNPFRVQQRGKERSKSLVVGKSRKEKKEQKEESQFLNDDNTLEEINNEIENETKLILTTEKPEDCFTFDYKAKTTEIEGMISQLVEFLNSKVLANKEISGIVLDFIQSKDKKWFLLDCKECSIESKDTEGLKRKNSKVIHHQRTQSNPELKINILEENEPKESNFIQKTENMPNDVFRSIKPRQLSLKKSKICPAIEISEPIEKDLFKRYSQVSEKIDKIIEKNHLPPISNCSIKDQCINIYNDRINSISQKSKSQTPSPNESDYLKPSFPCLQHNLLSRHKAQRNKPLWNDESHAFTKKHYSDIVELYDEMKLNSKNTSLNQNFVSKYGGDEFWNKFVVKLFQKIISENKLNKRFEDSNQKMILSGLRNVFSGNVSLEFRRSIRTIHQNLGILEEEFNLFLDKMEEALDEFRIEENDKVFIMSQIRSMICLVCKSH
ncbi:unnamed protein product [Blepharisma stoltei]|uniref:SPK domain-containing protein n=1 Tax=Blepharisma stoltei TaxID=1481888 RepID=A0AAU9IZ23_9CILI|nr:unnamed protein product [Blepharisma stoltei]